MMGTYFTIVTVLIGMVLLSITSGLLGTFALLRRQSMLGDAMSHATLPGIGIAFLCTQSNNPFILLTGGALTSCLGAILVTIIVHFSPLKRDTALGIILSVFFGVGLIVLTIIQKKGAAQQAVLNKFLFGNVATLLPSDLYGMAFLAFLIILGLGLLWKECVVYSFDPLFTQALGYKVVWIEGCMIVLLSLALVIGLQTVGVVLMSSMLIAPAAAARQWCKGLKSMIGLATLFSLVTSTGGALLSYYIDRLPTGPTIVLLLGCVVFVSFYWAPERRVSYHDACVS